jgi:hypothetical protein
MSIRLDKVETRWRVIAMNPRAKVKIRIMAVQLMKHPSDRFLCQLLNKCAGGKKGGAVELEFVVTERLARLRELVMNRKIMAGTLVRSGRKK